MAKASKIVGVSLGAALAAAAGFGAPSLLADKDFDVASAPKDVKELCSRGINNSIQKLSQLWLDKDCATKVAELRTNAFATSGIALPAKCTEATDACIKAETKRHEENDPMAHIRPTNIKCSMKVANGELRITQCAPLAP